MNKFWHKIEKIVDWAIFPCLILLLGIIIVEIFYRDFAHYYHIEIVLADTFIILVFVADLVFKYIRMRNVPMFLRRYWLDILAVFPFYLFFRMIEIFLAFMPISESFKSIQMILHEGLEVEKEGSKIVSQAGKSSRFNAFIRLLKPALRLPRFLKVASYFEKPTGDHHHYEKIHKEKKQKTGKLKKTRKK